MTPRRSTFEEAVQKGHDYAWNQEWERAIEEYKRALGERPDDLVVHNSLGLALLRAGRLREALGEYRAVSKLSPEDLTAQRRIAEIYTQLERYSEAEEAWRNLALFCEGKGLEGSLEAWSQVVRLNPESEDACLALAEAHAVEGNTKEAAQGYLALAGLYQKKGRLEEATQCCRRALVLDGESIEARRLLHSLLGPAMPVPDAGQGPVEEAMQGALRRLAEVIMDPSFKGHAGVAPLSRAIDLQAQGLLDEAIKEYETAWRKGVEENEMLLVLGCLYAQVGRCQEAEQCLERAASVVDYALPGHLILGDCYRQKKDPRRGLMHLLEAVKIVDLKAAKEELRQDLARSYEGLWQSDREGDAGPRLDAIAEFFGSEGWEARALALRQQLDELSDAGLTVSLAEAVEHEHFEEILGSMAAVHDCWKRRLPFAALEECYAAIERMPQYLPLHLLLAGILAKLERSEEALEKYLCVAKEYRVEGVPQRAIAIYKKATELAPLDLEVRRPLIALMVEEGDKEGAAEEYITLAEAQYHMAQMEEVLSTYREALSLGLDSSWEARIRHRKADLHLQRAEWKEALKEYEKVVRLDPEDGAALQALADLHFRAGEEKKALEVSDRLLAWHSRQEGSERVLEVLKEMVEARPKEIGLRKRLCQFYLAAGRNKEAIKGLDALGELQLEAGLKSEARETIKLIISLEPKGVDSYRQLLRQIGDSEPQEEA